MLITALIVGGTGSRVYYNVIMSANLTFSIHLLFAGVVSVAGTLDRERTNFHQLTVAVDDQGQPTSLQVHILIRYRPQISYKAPI